MADVSIFLYVQLQQAICTQSTRFSVIRSREDFWKSSPYTKWFDFELNCQVGLWDIVDFPVLGSIYDYVSEALKGQPGVYSLVVFLI